MPPIQRPTTPPPPERPKDETSNPTTIDSLPNELLLQILSLLADDAPALSDSRLHDQPKASMLDNYRNQTLKNVSTVSKRWRELTLPLLFRHVLWTVDDWEELCDLDILDFLRERDLGRHVKTFALVFDTDDDDNAGEGGSRIHDLLRNNLSPWSPKTIPGMRRQEVAWEQGDNNFLWEAIFDVVTDPLRFTIMAPPRVLARLISRSVYIKDEWCFRTPLHILSLSRDAAGPTSSEREDMSDSTDEEDSQSSTSEGSAQSHKCTCPPRHPCTLLTLLPWTSLLLNEGSSMRAYRTADWFHLTPPSILGALLGCEYYPNDTPLLPPLLRSLSYVAIFPLATHLDRTLVEHLPRGLDSFFVQLVPRPQNFPSGVEPADLFSERNAAYSCMMRAILTRRPKVGWKDIREFRSGDAADRDSWEMAVALVQGASREWRVAGDGVFVRRTREEMERDAIVQGGAGPMGFHSSMMGFDSSDDDDDSSTSGEAGDSDDEAGEQGDFIQSNLRLIAFNGTARLRVPNAGFTHVLMDHLF